MLALTSSRRRRRALSPRKCSALSLSQASGASHRWARARTRTSDRMPWPTGSLRVRQQFGLIELRSLSVALEPHGESMLEIAHEFADIAQFRGHFGTALWVCLSPISPYILPRSYARQPRLAGQHPGNHSSSKDFRSAASFVAHVGSPVKWVVSCGSRLRSRSCSSRPVVS